MLFLAARRLGAPSEVVTGYALGALSHDYQYYDVADRIVTLGYGRIVYDGPVESDPMASYTTRRWT